MSRNNFSSKYLVMACVIALALLMPSLAAAWTYYRWEDEKGTVHFTNTFTNIPPNYRDRAEVIEPRRKPITSVKLPGTPAPAGAVPGGTQPQPEGTSTTPPEGPAKPEGAPTPQGPQQPAAPEEKVNSQVLLIEKQIERDRQMLETTTDDEARKAIEKRIEQKQQELKMQQAANAQR